MEYIYLFVALICSGLLSIMSSSFSRENKELKNVTPFYNLVVTVFAFVTLGVLSLKDFVFDIITVVRKYRLPYYSCWWTYCNSHFFCHGF